MAKYLNFLDIISEKKTSMLLELTKLNQYTIKLQNIKKSPYKPIYSLKLVEFRIFKTYIKSNLANSFIHLLKSSTSILILIIQKSNNSFYLYIDSWSLNNLIIKN